MGSLPPKSVLMICGDYMEDYETIVPFQALQAFGLRVDCVSPGKNSGDKCLTAVHDYMGRELYTELPGHLFPLNANFNEVKPELYEALVIPGGRFTELFSLDNEVLNIVTSFALAGKPVVTTCHSQLLLVAAGLIKGRRCTAFPSMKSVVQFAGGVWVDPEPVTKCVMDGNFISAIGWPAHADLLSLLLGSMKAKISGGEDKSILFLCGDYVEDYEVNVPFRALGGLGCRVEAVSPTKKKGETCVTAIHDFEGAQVCSEKSGHYFKVSLEWDDIHVDDFDCVVIPGGRSPEFLVTHDKVIKLVEEFAETGKVVSAIGQGQWVLAAAGLLKGKRCASAYGVKSIVKATGGEIVDCAEGSLAHGKLLTATGWPNLPCFISDLVNLLGINVTF
ncbi:DJ-1 protein homolog E-like [Aristolochia californica]|uniref:DJ-1 protein homolog E-like n=1 Tax=Aristolochia californica TaxID=171875 RepID=UPI0035E0A375